MYYLLKSSNNKQINDKNYKTQNRKQQVQYKYQR